MFIDRKINGALIQDLAWGGADVKAGGRATKRGRDRERTVEEGKD